MESEQHDEAIEAGEAAIDCEYLLRGVAEGFESDGDVATGGGAAERKRRVSFESKFVADAGDDACGEVGIGEADDFEGVGAGEVVSAFDEFGGGQLEHFGDFSGG